MSAREARLRHRIDQLTDELISVKFERDYWRGLVVPVCAWCETPIESFKEKYCSADCRLHARRRQYRLAKQRKRNAVKAATTLR